VATIAQRFRNVGRISQIINTFVRFGFRKELQSTELVDYVPDDRSTHRSDESSRTDTLSGAQRLAMAFEELGPTFVKLGQLLAAREDVLPKNVILELKRLQDSAKPFPEDVLRRILAAEFGDRSADLFAEVDPKPLGAASIGQVHLAQTKEGRKVVLKVQRPEVEALIRTDLSILHSLASFFESVIPEIRLLRPTVVVEELARSLHAELDYFREASNTERMRGLFEGHSRIHIPEILRDRCTKHVLCMEFIEGNKLTSLKPSSENAELVRTGVRAFLDMTFKFGIFHADLHPGNFMQMAEGRLAILDFGLTARLSREIRNTLLFMFLALVREDLESFSRFFLELTEAGPEVDLHTMQMEVREAVESALNLPMSELQIGKLLMNVARISASCDAPVSRELVLFFRALIALESFGKSLDPSFEVLKEATLYAKELPGAQLNRKFLEQESIFLLRDSQALLKELPFTLRLLAKRLQAGNLNFRVQSDEVAYLGREIDRASNRLSLALLLGALVMGSSILTFNKEGRVYESLSTLGLVGFGAAGVIGIWLAVSILRSGRFK
jgi:ubiquinone biosynthesis protein